MKTIVVSKICWEVTPVPVRLRVVAPNFNNMNNQKEIQKIQECMDRAESLMEEASLVNMAQYAHGINSAIASIRFNLDRLRNAHPYEHTLENKNYVMLWDSSVKLAGYLYWLKRF